MSQEIQDVQPVLYDEFVLETTDLQVIRSLGDPPTNIVLFTDPFDIALTFQGQPLPVTSVWWMMKNTNQPFRIDYYAESLDPNPDVTLGSINAVLSLAFDIYSSVNPPANRTTLTVAAGAVPRGIYRLSAKLTFTNFVGWTGFFEGDAFQVV